MQLFARGRYNRGAIGALTHRILRSASPRRRVILSLLGPNLLENAQLRSAVCAKKEQEQKLIIKCVFLVQWLPTVIGSLAASCASHIVLYTCRPSPRRPVALRCAYRASPRCVPPPRCICRGPLPSLTGCRPYLQSAAPPQTLPPHTLNVLPLSARPVATLVTGVCKSHS